MLRLKLYDVNHFLKKRNISKRLHNNILKYLEYIHEDQIYGYKRGSHLIEKLSDNLQQDIKVETFLKCLIQVKWLSNRMSKQFLKKLCSKIVEESYGPNEIINFVIYLNIFVST